MATLLSMYGKLSVNNKVNFMKKLFNLKMSKVMTVAQYLNEFDMITNQLSLVDIDFNDENRALILLTLLPSRWEAIGMAVNNSGEKMKLSYDDVHDMILTKEVYRKYFEEFSGMGLALGVDD